jgi:hypothetical protein
MGACGGRVMMQEMPKELLLAFVVQASSVEDLAALRRVSRTWHHIVDASLTNWVRQLPVGEQLAASTGARLWILRHFADIHFFHT